MKVCRASDTRVSTRDRNLDLQLGALKGMVERTQAGSRQLATKAGLGAANAS